MFCPQCKAEYRDGFYRCADCDLELVSQLTPEAAEPESAVSLDWVVVHTFHEQHACVAFCKKLIAADIPFHVDETNRQFWKDVERTFVVRLAPEHFTKAKEILDEACIADGPADEDE